VKVAPARLAPFWSWAVAVICVVRPTKTLDVTGMSDSDVSTGTNVTVIAALPDLPSLVALTTAVPAATPVICRWLHREGVRHSLPRLR